MTSADSTDSSGSSRLLVGFCCFITFITVVFCSVGFMVLAWKLRAHNERILALEENQLKTTTDPFSKSLNTGKFDFLFLIVNDVSFSNRLLGGKILLQQSNS